MIFHEVALKFVNKLQIVIQQNRHFTHTHTHPHPHVRAFLRVYRKQKYFEQNL